MGLSVWCCDQAGPFQTVPVPGVSWQPEGKPAWSLREYFQQYMIFPGICRFLNDSHM